MIFHSNRKTLLVLIFGAAILVGALLLLDQKSPLGAGNSGIRGTVLLGPLCPVVREGEECPDRVFETRLALTTPDGARIIKEFDSDADGRFEVAVRPGEYAIRSAVAANVLPYCGSGTVKVNAGEYTEVTVQCDTGIR